MGLADVADEAAEPVERDSKIYDDDVLLEICLYNGLEVIGLSDTLEGVWKC